MPQYDLIIGGETVAPASGEYFEVVAPATESVMAPVAGGRTDVCESNAEHVATILADFFGSAGHEE